MKKMPLRALSLILAVALAFPQLSVTAFAGVNEVESADEVYAGGFRPLTAEERDAVPTVASDKYGARARIAFGAPTAADDLQMMVDYSVTYPSPGDQGPQASCASWALGYSLRSSEENLINPGNVVTPFSPAFTYNILSKGKISAGSTIPEVAEVLKTKGIVPFSVMPYVPDSSSLQPNVEQLAVAAQYKSKGYAMYNFSSQEELIQKIKTDLSRRDVNGVIYGFFIYGPTVSLQNAKLAESPIYNEPGSYPAYSCSAHAVVLVGYDDRLQAFKYINSYGPDWGYYGNGTGYISYDYVRRNASMAEAYRLDDLAGEIYNRYSPIAVGESEVPYSIGVVNGARGKEVVISVNQRIDDAENVVARIWFPQVDHVITYKTIYLEKEDEGLWRSVMSLDDFGYLTDYKSGEYVAEFYAFDSVGNASLLNNYADADGYYFNVDFVADNSYRLIVERSDGGSVIGGYDEYVQVGETVYLYAEASRGYTFEEWDVLGADPDDVYNPALEFVMPEGDVTVTALFSGGQSLHMVTTSVAPTGGGVVSSSHILGAAYTGDLVKLTALKSSNYHFVEWTRDDGEEASTDLVYAFTMPDYDLHVTAVFERDEAGFSVNPSTIGSGWVSVYPPDEKLYAGTEVFITAQPGAGYYLADVMGTGGAPISVVSPNQISFIMPSANVNPIVAFEPLEAGEVAVSAFVNILGAGYVTTDVSLARPFKQGQVITLKAFEYEGYKFVRWTYGLAWGHDGQRTDNYVVSGEPNQLLTAIFEEGVADKYPLSVKEIGGGFVERILVDGVPYSSEDYDFDNFEVAPGSQVRVIGVTGDGYVIKDFDSNVDDFAVSLNEISFVMPAKTAEVTVVYKNRIELLSEGSGSFLAFTSDGASFEVGKSPVYIAADKGEEISLSAAPENGYAFANYTIKDSNRPNGEVMSADADYIFETPDAPQITVTANFEGASGYSLDMVVRPDDSAGSVTGAWAHKAGETVTLTAFPSEGYRFVGWYDGANPIAGAENETYTFIMPAKELHYRAVFELIPPDDYNVITTVSPSGTGSVTGAGAYQENETVTLSAAAASGHKFVSWVINGFPVSANEIYSFVMPARDVHITAVFEEMAADQYNVTVNVTPPGYGSATGAGKYEEGVAVRLEAAAGEGRRFERWERNGVAVSEDSAYEFTMPAANVSVTAVFALAVETAYDLTLHKTGAGLFSQADLGSESVLDSINAAPPNSGVTRAVKPGEQVVIAVASDSLQTFSRWETDVAGAVISGDTISFIMPAREIVVKAIFINSVNILAIDGEVSDASGSLVMDYASGDGGHHYTGYTGHYKPGEQVTFTASPRAGSRFHSWFSRADGTVVPDWQRENPVYSFVMPKADINLGAQFEDIPNGKYNLEITVNGSTGSLEEASAMGYVMGRGVYAPGDSVTLIAIPMEGYRFVNWKANGVVQSSDATHTFNMPASSVSYTATFQAIPDSYQVYVYPSEYATISGSGDYEVGETVTLEYSDVREGVRFLRWVVDAGSYYTQDILSFTMPARLVTVVAEFEPAPPDTYELSITALPEFGGTVTGEGEYLENGLVTVTAEPNEGYRFVMWQNDGATSMNAEYSFNMPANDLTLTAVFELLPPSKYTLTVEAAPAEGGDVSDGGEYEENAVVTLVASPAENYRLVGWTVDGDTRSTKETYNFVMPSNDVTVVAVFEEIPKYSVTVETIGEGTVDGEGLYEANASVVLTANPAEGYVLSEWSMNGSSFKGSTLSFVMPSEDVTVTATFDSAPPTPQYALNVIKIPAGSVAGDVLISPDADALEAGAEVTLTAVPGPGYRFSMWQKDGETYTDSTLEFAMPEEDVTVTAVFEKLSYAVTVSASPEEAAAVIYGDGVYAVNDDVTLLVDAWQPGYHFVGWSIDGDIVSNERVYEFTMPASDVDVVALFEENAADTYYLTVEQSTYPNNNSVGGSVTGGGYYKAGEEVTVTATVNEGHYFGGWSRYDAVEIDEDVGLEYSFIMPSGDVTVIAQFSEVPYYTINVITEPEECGSMVIGGGKWPAGLDTFLDARPEPGYKFSMWLKDGELYTTDMIASFGMPERDVTMTAIFEKLPYNVTVSASPEEAAPTIGGDGVYTVGDSVTLTAGSWQSGYNFIGWSIDDVIVSEEETYTFTMPASDVDIVALFEEIPAAYYEVTVELSNLSTPGGGSVTGGGFYRAGDPVTITATANEGHEFHYWATTDGIVSNDAEYTFVMPENDVTYLAYISNDAMGSDDLYSVDTDVFPVGSGTVTGAGDYPEGDMATVEAIPNAGYQFVRFDIVYSPQYTLTYYESVVQFTANRSETVIARAVFSPISYRSLTLEVSPSNVMGRITSSASGDVAIGDEVELQAVAFTGYHFTGWIRSDGVTTPDSATYAFTMGYSDLTVTAVFAADAPPIASYLLTTAISPENSGSITGGPLSSLVEENSAVNLTAVPSEGYVFSGWSRSDGVVVASGSEYAFDMPSHDLTITAAFEPAGPKEYKLTAAPNNTNYGDVASSAGSSYAKAGDQITLTATEKSGYKFVRWYRSDAVAVDGEELTYTFSMPERGVAVIAIFEPLAIKEYELKLQAGNGGVIRGAETGFYKVGQKVTVTAVANASYRFVGWERSDGAVVTSAATLNIVMPSKNLTVKALFAAVSQTEHTLTIVSDGSGSVTGAYGLIEEGERVTLGAYPSTGYRFKLWERSDGEVVSLNEILAFDMPAYDLTVRAVFELSSAKRYSLVTAPNISARGYIEDMPYSMQRAEGDSVTLKAVAKSGYQFDRWQRSDGATTPESDTYTVVMPNHSVSVVAVFVPDLEFGASAVTIAASLASFEKANDSAAAVTTALEKKIEYGWENNPVQIVTPLNAIEDQKAFEVSKSPLKAKPFGAPGEYDVYLVYNQYEGTITGLKTSYAVGDTVEITASPKRGFRFDHWETDDVTIVDRNNPTASFQMPDKDVGLRPVFVSTYHDVELIFDDERGYVDFDRQYNLYAGETARFEAVPLEGYLFESWEAEGVDIDATSAEITFIMPDASVTLRATFRAIPGGALVLEVENTGNITGEAGGAAVDFGKTASYEVAVGETVSLEWITDNDNMFVGWYVDGVDIGANLIHPYEFEMPQDGVTVKAVFRPVGPGALRTAYSNAHGLQSAGLGIRSNAPGKAPAGSKVAFEIVTKSGYKFVEWKTILGVPASSYDKKSPYIEFTMPNSNIVLLPVLQSMY
ncbi:MAG: InlB B-repeat-containing protein [Clostridiales bacterium]|jgi:hypothetical protein|nr:InlB B-repeat-containing protein [Clostridiales bacterium]